MKVILPSFSIIMPTYNRAHCICNAIDSVLKQAYPKFELIIVDDGSTDKTCQMIESRYVEQLKSQQIVLKKLDHAGVCKARNEGLRCAKNDWIAYVDSDNTITKCFLGVFAKEIMQRPDVKNFYAQWRPIEGNGLDWSQHCYSLSKLMYRNFIDLGVYVHHRSLIDELGMFDEDMKRLVDWDLILRQCLKHEPHYIPCHVMNYNNVKSAERITYSVKDVSKWIKYVQEKYKKDYLNKIKNVTTIIIAYNHEDTIDECIKSALAQTGMFSHTIIIIDDYSTDKTFSVISKYKKYKNVVIHKNSSNIGQALTLKKALALVKSQYVSILEGDDVWSSSQNIQKKINFLEDPINNDCSMVFSKICIYNSKNKNNIAFLSPVQHSINKSKLTEDDVLSINGLNPLCNYSCCMFKTDILKMIPEDIFMSNQKFISEIAIAFLCLRFGNLGFIDEILTIYRIHSCGSYSSANNIQKLELQLNARQQAMRLCSFHAKNTIQKIYVNIQQRLSNAKNNIR